MRHLLVTLTLIPLSVLDWESNVEPSLGGGSGLVDGVVTRVNFASVEGLVSDEGVHENCTLKPILGIQMSNPFSCHYNSIKEMTVP